MQLVLMISLGFILIGLIAPRFEGRQQIIVVAFAMLLAAGQYFFAQRFL